MTAALLDNRGDPDARSVLEDYERTVYTQSTTARLGFALWIAAADAAAYAAYAAAAAYAASAADAAEASADAAEASAAAAADAAAAFADADAAAAFADADYYTADAAYNQLSRLLLEEPDMTDGFKIIQIPGRYGYSATFACWLRRVSGDEWDMLPGARFVGRISGDRTISQLASDGPKQDHELWPPTETVEHVHRLVIRRALAANEKVWAEHCPMPKEWTK